VNPTETSALPCRIKEKSQAVRDWAIAVGLFLATASVVVWQNLRVGVLWDLSYILETSQRISRGDMPYRDFPLPYAPLTFLVQTAVIKLTGRVFFHHVIYAAVAGGFATVITWRILVNLLRDKAAGLLAFLLAAPLAFLGIYSIFPHPFYDPDCTLAILIAIFLLQRAARNGFPPLWAFCAGGCVAIPLFVKQNTGLAFLAAMVMGVAALVARNLFDRRPVRGYLWAMAGTALALAFAAALIHFTAGLANYWHWTVQFAGARRLPSLSAMLAVYETPLPLVFAGAFLAAVLLLRRNGKSRRTSLAALVLLSAPFVWAVAGLFLNDNSSERVEQLLVLWPFLLIVSFLSALWNIPRRTGLDLVLPFVLIATVHGAFLSQQVWGSTYALWPLLILLLAYTFSGLFPAGRESASRGVMFAAAGISLLVSGSYYAWSHERLDYAKVSEGEMNRSPLPELKGLSIRGRWIPQFEQLVGFARQEIPAEDGLLIIPGEDLFYFTTGRRPQFPVLMFDHTVNPLAPEEILAAARARNIRWLIVKKELQLNGEPVEEKARLLDLLTRDFRPVQTVGIYDIYRRAP
jgi:hypothetical protein